MSGGSVPDLRGVKRVLMVQLGDIGDVVWTWPSIYAVKAKLPEAKIFLLTRRGRGGLLEGNPLLEGIIEVEQPKGNGPKSLGAQIKFLKQLRRRHFDLAIDLRADERGAFLARISGAPLRFAVSYKLPFWRNMMFTHLAVSSPHEGPYRGPAEHSLSVLRPFGMDIAGEVPLFPVPEVIAARVDSLLHKAAMEPSNRYITISPYSRWKYKECSQDMWRAVLCRLWERWGMYSVIVGGLEDREASEELRMRCGDFVRNFAGKTTLSELAGTIKRGILHIGVDTGGGNIAAALGVPTVTIYGPSFWEGWAHPGLFHRQIFPERDCVPCHKTGCDDSGHSQCLEQLDPPKVILAVEELLSEIC